MIWLCVYVACSAVLLAAVARGWRRIDPDDEP